MELHRKKSVSNAEAGEDKGVGRIWVWAGVDSKTRLIMHFFVGGRTLNDARYFLATLAGRLNNAKPLFTSDELVHYATALKEIYSKKVSPSPTGKPGRPAKTKELVHEDLDYATVHKTRKKGRVVKVDKILVYGNAARIEDRLTDSPSNTVNTSFVERVNGILRQMDSHLKRKALTFAKTLQWFVAKLNLTVVCYNLIRPHSTLSRNPDRTTTPRTPAMLAGLAKRPLGWSNILDWPIVCNY